MKNLTLILFLTLSKVIFSQWINGNPDFDVFILGLDRSIDNLQLFEPLPNESSSYEAIDSIQVIIDERYNKVLNGKYSIQFLRGYTYMGRKYCEVHIVNNEFYDVPSIEYLPDGYGSFNNDLSLIESAYQEGKLIEEIDEIFKILNSKK